MTLRIDGNDMRLWGVDAPASAWTCTRQGISYPCQELSRRALEVLATAGELRCHAAGDDDGAVMCVVEGQDLGHLMVLSGWATARRKAGSTGYALQEEAAREAKVGMWKEGQSGQPPSAPGGRRQD